VGRLQRPQRLVLGVPGVLGMLRAPSAEAARSGRALAPVAGAWRGESTESLNKEYTWMRGGDIFGEPESTSCGSHPAALFENKIQPADIAQGQLGDCWMMAALASLVRRRQRDHSFA